MEAQKYEADVLNQHFYQPDAGYWLTSESPIARAFSVSTSLRNQSSSIGFATIPPPTSTESKDCLQNDFNASLIGQEAPSLQFDDDLHHLHLSQLDSPYAAIPGGPIWPLTGGEHIVYDHSHSTGAFQPPAYDYADSYRPYAAASPYSSSSLYDDSPIISPCLSSSALYPMRYDTHAPRSSPHDDRDIEYEEDVSDGKPYARLIYEALLQAPGHRMMLRDIYEWFEQNTNKARESGSNGWQNSIRHNLSMNKAFENDKTHCTNARGEPKKATSVWFLTREALIHGVQSTTRYRKTGGVRKTGLSRSPDYRRQRSGAKGGRAARRAARLRRMEQHHADWAARSPHGVSNLAQPANYLPLDYSGNCESSPATPSESLPYTPRSLTQRLDCGLYNTSGMKMDATEGSTDEVRGQDFLFQQHVQGGMDDSW